MFIESKSALPLAITLKWLIFFTYWLTLEEPQFRRSLSSISDHPIVKTSFFWRQAFLRRRLNGMKRPDATPNLIWQPTNNVSTLRTTT
jgi:hypothetical protein